jgi:hypothetical protein
VSVGVSPHWDVIVGFEDLVDALAERGEALQLGGGQSMASCDECLSRFDLEFIGELMLGLGFGHLGAPA